jgi:DNA topoisomerase-1
VVKEDRAGEDRAYYQFVLKNGAIEGAEHTEKTRYEKSKLFPTDIGSVVNNFLVEYFDNILDYNFTASVEKEFDEIAEGQKEWNKMIQDFYGPFHQRIEKTLEVSKKQSGERLLGKDPVSGEHVYAKIGRYGPIVQIGESQGDEKPRFAGMIKGQSIESITLEEALELFKLPRTLGTYEDQEMIVAIGRFGPYVKHANKFYSLEKADDPLSISFDRGVELIEQKRKAEREKIILEFKADPSVKVLRGRYGAYIAKGKNNYRIPKSKDPAKLTLEECMEIINAAPEKKSGRKK